MPQSFSAVCVHLVFSTKDRKPFLVDEVLRSEMHAFICAHSAKLNCLPIIAGGVEDHVHILAWLGRTVSQSNWVKEIKRVSSIWVKQRDPRLGSFSWQRGYATFSVGLKHAEVLKHYIANQVEHHRNTPYKNEFRGLLRKHNLEWDEKHIWS